MQNEVPHFPYKHHHHHQRPQKTVLSNDPAAREAAHPPTHKMASQQLYPDPPPSYAEATGADQFDIRRHTLLTTTTTSSISSSAAAAATSRRRRRVVVVVVSPVFPHAFSLYSLSPRHYVIGDGRNCPLYAVSTYALLSSRPDVVIHNGTSQDCTF
ncbi:hypothetical protein F4823DRAFT_587696 [Ustulina deusta]|nr:hypothetical protein F4823DRAFT_587696 [Ustulina deusta]